MERQIQVLAIFENTEQIFSKKEIKSKSGISYYCNTDKHLGDVLNRMVKNGLLIRVKIGSYRWSGRTKPNHMTKEIIPKEQQKLEL